MNLPLISISRALHRLLTRSCFTSSTNELTTDVLTSKLSKLEDKYKKMHDQSSNVYVSKRNVFTNTELSLKYRNVYGFDFDYTLVQYTPEALRLIYETAKQSLIKDLSYPEGLRSMEYDSEFAIRGLHLDVRKGLLMKMDAYHHIQLGSVYRGRTPVPSDEVVRMYGGIHVPLNIMDDHMHRMGLEGTSSSNMIQFLDWFSIPEVNLFADVSQYFFDNKIPFDPEYLYTDVENTIKKAHISGRIHNLLASDPDRYIEDDSLSTLNYLTRLKEKNKKLFILTNSPFWFVDKGMRHVTKSKDWMDLFDVVI